MAQAPRMVTGVTLNGERKGMGYRPDLADFRDFTPRAEQVRPLLEKTAAAEPKSELPDSADLREWCSPIEDQGQIGSCTANAGCGVVEYLERRATGKHLDASRLFLYKATRNLMRETGDTGAYLRTTMGALHLFGVPPEEYWPYTDDAEAFDNEPPPFCYAFGASFQAITFYRLDPAGTAADEVLSQIKTHIASGLPSMFGFTVYDSIRQAGSSGAIPFPSAEDSISGGHAVVAVGYDDGKEITNDAPGSETKTGALMIRNSWGPGWGEEGYGWLPYDYVKAGLAEDWWVVLSSEWVDTEAFNP